MDGFRTIGHKRVKTTNGLFFCFEQNKESSRFPKKKNRENKKATFKKCTTSCYSRMSCTVSRHLYGVVGEEGIASHLSSFPFDNRRRFSSSSLLLRRRKTSQTSMVHLARTPLLARGKGISANRCDAVLVTCPSTNSVRPTCNFPFSENILQQFSTLIYLGLLFGVVPFSFFFFREI